MIHIFDSDIDRFTGIKKTTSKKPWQMLAVLAVLFLSFTLIKPARAQMPPCTPDGADLTGVYAVNPCVLTRFTRALETNAMCYMGMNGNCGIVWGVCNYANTFEGGEQFANYLNDWWTCQHLPALRNQTKQLHASVVDQSRQLSSTVKSINLSKAIREQQNMEYENRKRLIPNELTCVAGTHATALAYTQNAANDLTQGFKNDQSQRDAPGQPGEHGGAADLADRFEKYCEFFNNPEANAGRNACPNPATPGLVVDGDIGIEDFLFRDTIDFSREENREAAKALIANLVVPRTWERIPNDVIDTATGHEIILYREYIESIQNILEDVIGNMLARRAAAPLTDDIARTIFEIRERAGVRTDPDQPRSYNEIMLAMTKERFFDPLYLIKNNNVLGSIKQEQTSLEAFVAVQLLEIETMQERINLLLAARASLKYNAEAKPNMHEYAPVRAP